MIKSNAYHIMAKPTGSICNLDCQYCFYLEKEKLYPGKNNWVMPEGTLRLFIKNYIESQNVPSVNFTWQGGEPTLLGVDYFRKVIELQNEYSGGKEIMNAFQTNAVLLNDEWCELFKENIFLIGVSIDGPPELHDRYRYFKGKQSSFDKVIASIELLKKHKVEFNTLTCVQGDNSYQPLKVYKFLKEIGSKYMQFIPIVEREVDIASDSELNLISPNSKQQIEVANWSVKPLQYGKFLAQIFNEWVRNDVGEYFVQLFEVTLESWVGMKPGLCIFGETCGTAMALEHNGDLYSCDHYVYPENKLGNIVEDGLRKLVDSAKQIKFGNDKRDTLPKYCKQCEFKFACNGECPKHRFIKTPDGEEGLNYLCAGYKYFFNYVDSYMRFMAIELRNNRPVKNVMSFAKEFVAKTSI
ncbi:MAG: anaerobic sulfatase maturase [Ignavibacteria bacterium RBG_13_36_8]|nr:MAG: anaerobic sulfatase maturase [Ignavibacteria bacterium RBG_13_36_8]